MKNFLSILILFAYSTFSASCQTADRDANSYPEPIGYVNDLEHVLSVKEVKELDSLITRFEQQTQIEIAIVTLDSTMTSKDNFEQYTLGLATYWGVGKKDLDNGILIGVSSGLRSIWIHNGYGIEKTITDEATKKIVDDIMIPRFRVGNYFEGIKAGTLELMRQLGP